MRRRRSHKHSRPYLVEFLEPRLLLSTLTVVTPTGTQDDNVTISFSLTNSSSDKFNIAADYSTDDGSTWHAATAAAGGSGTSNLTSSPSGIAHTFVWNSATDLSSAADTVIFEINAALAPGNPATPDLTTATSDFSLDNQTIASLALHVSGTTIENSNNQSVVLHGMDITGLEMLYYTTTPAQAAASEAQVLASEQVAVTTWDATLLRLPLNEDSWFGYGQSADPGDGGYSYRAVVDQFVAYAAQHGVYVLLDLHWSDEGVWGGSNLGQHEMPDDHSTLFWESVAARYANNPATLFDPYNEPQNVTAQVWNSGGAIDENGVTYNSPGMQGLVNTIRATGATNIIAAEGTGYASSLAAAAADPLTDPDSNLVYSVHVYPPENDYVISPAHWTASLDGVENSYPILIGEFGVELDPSDGGNIGSPTDASANAWTRAFLTWAASGNYSWAAFSFEPAGVDYSRPNLLADTTAYTANSYFGAYVEQYLTTGVIASSPTGTLVADDQGVSLTWDAITDYQDGNSLTVSYNIYRTTVDDPATSPVEVASDLSATTFTDDTVAPGENYFYWIQPTDSAGTAGYYEPQTISLVALPAVQLAISPNDSTAPAGVVPITVTIEAINGSPVTSDDADITLTGAPFIGDTTVAAKDGIATFTNLSITTPGNYTIQAADAADDLNITTSLTIIPAAPAKLVFTTEPLGTMAGKTIPITVAIEDAFGNLETTDDSDVTLTGPPSLGGTTTVAAVDGIATFTTITVMAAGKHTLTAADSADSLSSFHTASFTITPAAPDKLVFTIEPAATTAGAVFSLAVSIEDVYGNIETTDDNDITITGPPSLGGTTTLAAKNGVATFTALSITAAGSHTLTAADAADSLHNFHSTSFKITPAAAATLVFTTEPVKTTAGKKLAAVLVTIEDIYGNVETASDSTITISIASGPGTFASSSTLKVAAVGGVATFKNLVLDTAGAYTLKAVAGKLASATSKSFKITA